MNLITKPIIQNFETAIINKKINKKNKQFKVSAKDKIEQNDLVTKQVKIENRKNTNFSQIIKKISRKSNRSEREISNKDFSKNSGNQRQSDAK